jgi:hypothetical protein
MQRILDFNGTTFRPILLRYLTFHYLFLFYTFKVVQRLRKLYRMDGRCHTPNSKNQIPRFLNAASCTTAKIPPSKFTQNKERGKERGKDTCLPFRRHHLCSSNQASNIPTVPSTMIRSSALFTGILFLLVLWEQIHATIIHGEDDDVETAGSQRELGNLGFQALEIFNRPGYRPPRKFSYMKKKGSNKNDDSAKSSKKSSKSSKSKSSKSDKASKLSSKSSSSNKKKSKKRKKQKVNPPSDGDTTPQPTPEPTRTQSVLPPVEGPTPSPVLDPTPPPVVDPTPRPTPSPTPTTAPPTPLPTTKSPTIAPILQNPSPDDQQCRVPADECCEDSDCDANTVCAGRNCVSEGSLRITVTWLGQGK